MELVYNTAVIITITVLCTSIIGIVRPSVLRKILGKFARRKYILVGGLALTLMMATIVGVTEPEHIKQARLEKERLSQVQKAADAAPKTIEDKLNTQNKKLENNNNLKPNSKPKSKPKPKPTCDGKNINSNCQLDGVNYKTYIYHAAIAEKSHSEQVVTYEKKVTSYCTLCQDGTMSPSCATGRGACSHHGGVAQWNAPVYSNIPVYSTKKVVDTPAKEAFIEKVAE